MKLIQNYWSQIRTPSIRCQRKGRYRLPLFSSAGLRHEPWRTEKYGPRSYWKP